jgi:uncharacterized protein (DUF1330 family)
MPAYFLVDIREIKDAAKMDEYRSRVARTVEKFGGRYLVRGGPFEVVEGTYQPVRLAMLEFPSMDQAQSCMTRKNIASSSRCACRRPSRMEFS